MEKNFMEDAKLFKALCDENRLRIMEMLNSGEKCACVLLEELEISQPTLSHHMKILVDSGIVRGRKEGKWMHYSVCDAAASRIKGSLNGYVDKKVESREEAGEHPCRR